MFKDFITSFKRSEPQYRKVPFEMLPDAEKIRRLKHDNYVWRIGFMILFITYMSMLYSFMR